MSLKGEGKMYAEFAQTPDTTQARIAAIPTSYVVAALLGAGLGLLLSLIWPHLTGMAALALWPLGMALGALGAGLGTMIRPGETAWGLVFAGQALGAVTLFLLLLAL
jgi:hypothetical protein